MDRYIGGRYRWYRLVLKHLAVYVLIAFAAEFVLFLLLYHTDKIKESIPVYLALYLVLPTVINVAAVISGCVIHKMEKFTERQKCYAVCLTVFVVCACLQCVHYAFSAVACMPLIAIFVTSIFGDGRLTKLIAYLSVLSTLISFFIGYIDKRDFSELVIRTALTLLILWCTYIITKLILEKEQEQAEVLIRNQESQSKMLYELQHDYLTGLYNRKFFFETLEYITSSGKRFCLGVMDIDDFKAVNDTYGHAIGDKVLMYVGEVLESCRGDQVYIGRIGGEEFAVLLVSGDEKWVQNKMEFIRKSIEEHDFYVDHDIESVSVTISIGVAVYRKGQTYQEVFGYGDQALYEAKKLGKNRIAWYSQSE